MKKVTMVAVAALVLSVATFASAGGPQGTQINGSLGQGISTNGSGGQGISTNGYGSNGGGGQGTKLEASTGIKLRGAEVRGGELFL